MMKNDTFAKLRQHQSFFLDYSYALALVIIIQIRYQKLSCSSSSTFCGKVTVIDYIFSHKWLISTVWEDKRRCCVWVWWIIMDFLKYVVAKRNVSRRRRENRYACLPPEWLIKVDTDDERVFPIKIKFIIRMTSIEAGNRIMNHRVLTHYNYSLSCPLFTISVYLAFTNANNNELMKLVTHFWSDDDDETRHEC